MSVLECKQEIPETKKHGGAIPVKNVLYATDFSATSELALPYATAICRHFGSTLHIAHVLSDTNLLLMTGGVDYISVALSTRMPIRRRRRRSSKSRVASVKFRT